MSVSRRTGRSLHEGCHKLPEDHFPPARVTEAEADRRADRLLELGRGELEIDLRESDREIVL